MIINNPFKTMFFGDEKTVVNVYIVGHTINFACRSSVAASPAIDRGSSAPTIEREGSAAPSG